MPAGFNHIDVVGEKVRLRPIKTTDASVAYYLVKNEAVLSTLAWDGPNNEEELLNTYRQWEDEMKAGDGYHLAIEPWEQPGIIGCIDIRFPQHPLQADIGYWLGEPFWNRGYMTDAVRLVCHFSLKHLDAARVSATVFMGNIGSRRALEKNDFSLDGTLRCDVYYKRGKWIDGWFFTVLRTEWEHNREKFGPRYEEVVLAKERE
ncbi:MAG: GNAT family N-acetyltransferase [Chloroflexi bacterium]|nr:GNAT family N-acetyltransferase [Chloroflexota bacterium]